MKNIITNSIIILIALGGIVWVVCKFNYGGLGKTEYTNNAQVRQHITPVNNRVGGFIREIRFEEYSPVHKGDTLVLIEDAEYQLRVAQAQADVQNAKVAKAAMLTSISTTKANIAATDQAINEAQIRLDLARKDYERYGELLSHGAVTQQQFDAQKTGYEAAEARLSQLKEQRKSQESVKAEQTQRLEQCDAAIALAQAGLNLAELNLSYTAVLATADGLTGRKNIHEGELVNPGQTLVSIVDNTEKWVVANYKETQTASMAEGQSVEITVDAVPGVKFKGVIAAISDATGAATSKVPQDNSAGNFVKVEQRIPVKIVFTADNAPEDLARLRAGMNAICRTK